MRVVSTTVYEYEELSEPAKAKARDWFRDRMDQWNDNFFADNVIDMAEEIAVILGITLNVNRDGQKAIFWSGFSCQGDGASFEGTYTYNPDAIRQIKDEYTGDTFRPLWGIANDLKDLQEGFDGKLACNVILAHRGSASYNMRAQCFVQTEDQPDGLDRFTDLDVSMTLVMRAFADWIYNTLRDEYDYSRSDEQVAENIVCNEYEFTEDGRAAK